MSTKTLPENSATTPKNSKDQTTNAPTTSQNPHVQPRLQQQRFSTLNHRLCSAVVLLLVFGLGLLLVDLGGFRRGAIRSPRFVVENEYNVKGIYGSENVRQLCSKVILEVHRPYICKDFETQAPLYSLKKWFGEYGKDYIQEGIIGFSRHCSRHSTGKAPQFRATALKFKSNSDIHQAIMKFIPANNFGELVPYGINEAKSIGEMFQIYFGKLFKSLEPQQVKFTSSEIKRSRDTGLYFYEGAFKHFKNPANIATVSHLRQGDALLKPHLPHPIVVSKYDDLMNQIVLPRIAHQLKANEKLDHKDLGHLMNLWSISSGMQKKNVFAETFTTEEEQSILVEYKETKRRLHNSIGNPGANKSAQSLLSNIIDDMEQILSSIRLRSSKKGLRASFMYSHDNNLVALFDYLGFFKDKESFTGRGVVMCANFQFLFLTPHEHSPEVRVLIIYNENVVHWLKNFNSYKDHTIDANEFVAFLKDQL